MVIRAALVIGLGLGLATGAGCGTSKSTQTVATAMDLALVDGMLDDWHAAASLADGPRYFGHFSEDAVFMGTDVTERWDLGSFKAYAEPHFSQGNGWTYTAVKHNITFDSSGGVAWFDELLESEKYGDVRGTGVLVKRQGEWKIAHYNMSFPLPNELTKSVVEQIRELEAGSSEE